MLGVGERDDCSNTVMQADDGRWEMGDGHCHCHWQGSCPAVLMSCLEANKALVG